MIQYRSNCSAGIIFFSYKVSRIDFEGSIKLEKSPIRTSKIMPMMAYIMILLINDMEIIKADPYLI